LRKELGVPWDLGLEDPVLLERKTVEGDCDGNELVLPVAVRKVDRGGYEDYRTVGVIELQTVACERSRGTENISKR